MGTENLSKLSAEALLDAYVENVHAFQAVEHVGAKNRIMERRFEIVDELKARSGPSLPLMRILLDHSDPHVRLSTAIKFRTIDHAAFERTVRPLAERSDEVGRDAQSSLRIDEHFQKVGYPEHDTPRVARELPTGLQWQCDNPPPAAMPRDEIARRLRAELPTTADRLMALSKAAIGLWPQRPRKDIPVRASRFGGMPSAPFGWSWPMHETEPMLFVGQINCADLHGMPGADFCRHPDCSRSSATMMPSSPATSALATLQFIIGRRSAI